MLDKSDKYYLTQAERLVMRVIWLADKELVLNEILSACNEQYDKEWKPQTVSTYLSHLVRKDFLKMERSGKYCFYHPLVSVKEYLEYDTENFAIYWGIDQTSLKSNISRAKEAKDTKGNNLIKR